MPDSITPVISGFRGAVITGTPDGTTFFRGDGTWSVPVGLITDGDKGDVTVSGSGGTFTIDAGVVTLAKMADIATDRLIGRDTAGTGVPEALAVSGGIEFTGSGGIQTAAFTGDVTKTAGGTALTIANGAVTFAKMQAVSANILLGNDAAGTTVEEITCTAAGRDLLDDADATAQRVTLSLVIGTNVQAWDADLDTIAAMAPAQGAIMHYGAAGWTTLAAGTSGQVLFTRGAGNNPAWDAVSSGVTDLRTVREMQFLANPGLTTATNVGFRNGITLNATVANTDDADGPWLQHTTGAVSGDYSGPLTSGNVLWPDWEPDSIFKLRTDASIADIRIWAYVASADPRASATPASDIAGFRYDTAADGTAFWRTFTNNGAGGGTSTTTTAAIAADTVYTLRVRVLSASVEFYVDGTLVATHTTELPTAGSILGIGIRVMTLTNAAKAIKWGRIACWHE